MNKYEQRDALVIGGIVLLLIGIVFVFAQGLVSLPGEDSMRGTDDNVMNDDKVNNGNTESSGTGTSSDDTSEEVPGSIDAPVVEVSEPAGSDSCSTGLSGTSSRGVSQLSFEVLGEQDNSCVTLFTVDKSTSSPELEGLSMRCNLTTFEVSNLTSGNFDIDISVCKGSLATVMGGSV